MINLGVTAVALKQLLRDASFSTTQNFSGATRSAQVAGHEVRDRLNASNPALVGGLEQVQPLSPEELSKLKLLLERL